MKITLPVLLALAAIGTFPAVAQDVARGATHFVFEPLIFIEHLAAPVPHPREHGVTYHGVLREFGRNQQQARSAYRAFVRAAIEEPPRSPLAHAVEGLIVGSELFIDQIRERLRDREQDGDVPALRALHSRPSLMVIIDHVAGAFEIEPDDMCRAASRSDDPSRAAVAWLARRRFGHAAAETARALGYARSSSIASAVQRIEASPRSSTLHRTLRRIEQALAND